MQEGVRPAEALAYLGRGLPAHHLDVIREPEVLDAEQRRLSVVALSFNTIAHPDAPVEQKANGGKAKLVALLPVDAAHAEDPERTLGGSDRLVRPVGRAEQRSVHRVRDDRMWPLARAAAAPRSLPDVLADYMQHVGALPDVLVAAAVLDAEAVDVIAPEADDDLATDRLPQVHPAAGERAVSEMDQVRLELYELCLDVLGHVETVPAHVLAQGREEIPVLAVAAIGHHVYVPAAPTQSEELRNEERLRELREVVRHHHDPVLPLWPALAIGARRGGA